VRVLFTTVGLPGHLFTWYRSLGRAGLVVTKSWSRPRKTSGPPPCAPAGSWSESGGVADVAETDRIPPEEQRFAHGVAFTKIARRSLSGANEIGQGHRHSFATRRPSIP
jgi:hypothetical protein